MQNSEKVALDPELEAMLEELRARTEMPKDADYSGNHKWDEKRRLAEWIAKRKRSQS